MKFLQERANTLALSYMFNGIGYSIVYPFIPLYLHTERGLPMSIVGLIFPVMSMAVILVPPVAGNFSDRFSRSAIIRTGLGGRTLLFLILTVLVFCNAPFWLFCILLFLNTSCGVIFENGADSYLAAVTTPESRVAAYSKIRIGNNIGWTLGPAIGAFLAGMPYWMLFLATAFLVFGAERFSAFFLPEPERPADVKSKLNDSGPNPLLHDHFMWQLLAGAFLLYLLASQLYSVFSVYSTSVIHLSRKALGFVYCFNGLTIILAQIPMIHLLKKLKIPPFWAISLGTLFYTLGYLSLGWAHSFTAAAVAVVILTLGETITTVYIYQNASLAAPPERVGRYLASVALVRGIGYALGPWLGSIAFDHLSASPVTLWATLSLAGVGSTVIFLSMALRKVQPAKH